jgi:3-oxoacyl-[acyl-carrier-protein] synthase II
VSAPLDRSAPRPRVVVTGLGMVSAAGDGVEAGWSMLTAGDSALRPIQLFDGEPYGGQLAGEALHLPRTDALPRGLQLLDVALREVLEDAGWTDAQRGSGTGVVLGTCQGDIEAAGAVHRDFGQRPLRQETEADVAAFAGYRPGAGTAFVGDRIGAEGPRATIGMVCVSSSVAILHAVDLLRRGECQRVLAGGFEGFSQFVFTGFQCIGALASGALRPFDEERDGTALGEAAVLLTLETLEEAQARGATIRAEIVGGGVAADAFHMTAPDPEGGGLERAIRQAFAEAGLGPADIDYISAHGTGTVFNDGMERAAFARVFGELAAAGRMPPTSGAKAVFGHTLGAAGALDAVTAILAMERGVLPPTVSHAQPIADWDFVPGQARPSASPLNAALSTNSAFGGNNSALLLQRWEGA